MNKIELGQAIAILANLGVIAGIVFLGIELRQNNELMEAEARRARAASQEESYTLVAVNADIAELLASDRAGATLSEAESLRLRSFWMRSLIDVQVGHAELPGSELGPVIQRQRLNRQLFPSLVETWKQRRNVFDPEFADWYDENVAGD